MDKVLEVDGVLKKSNNRDGCMDEAWVMDELSNGDAWLPLMDDVDKKLGMDDEEIHVNALDDCMDEMWMDAWDLVEKVMMEDVDDDSCTSVLWLFGDVVDDRLDEESEVLGEV